MKKVISIVCMLVCFCGVAQARELGHYAPGVVNIRDFAVPPQPGFYYLQYNLYYSANTYKDRNGDSVDALTVGGRTIPIDVDIESFAISPVLVWVTDKKLLGGDYAFYIVPSIVKNDPAASLSTLNRTLEFGDSSTGFGDIFVQPLWLGWRDKKYDLSLGLGVYIPVGRYNDGASNNIGLGFWTGQIQGAGYYYLDEQQASALMLSATYEVHSEKEGSDIRPGDHFTLEYGFSQYLSQRFEVGISGYSQWQTQGDKGHDTILIPNVKSEVHGIGGQVSYWVTSRLNLSLRYMKEYSAVARFEGDWVMLNITYLPGPLF
jgi:hypothetical protein